MVDRERTKTPTEALHNTSGTPAVNGSVRPHSRTGNGSVGNVAADLLRDLKAKEAELEGAKKQLAWMREGLGKASRAGYIFMDRDGIQEEGEGQSTELALRFKQFKAQIQVGRLNYDMLRYPQFLADGNCRTGETSVGMCCGGGTD